MKYEIRSYPQRYYTATKIELPTYIILQYGGMPYAQVTIQVIGFCYR